MNLPVPYRPGDILEVGCAPYVSEPHYCILTEVGDDCCGVQCLYPGENGRIEFGALKHGHYFSGCFDRKQYLSPLYGAKIYTGELSGEVARQVARRRLHQVARPDGGDRADHRLTLLLAVADDDRHVLCSCPAFTLLCAAMNEGTDLHTLADVQETDALGAV